MYADIQRKTDYISGKESARLPEESLLFDLSDSCLIEETPQIFSKIFQAQAISFRSTRLEY